jgi:CO dehydrogenase/acetyl-CoA synthase beta subunit
MEFDTTGTISAEEMRRSELLKANPGGITINVEGSVVAEDLPSIVERGLRELANQGGGFVDGQHFLEQNG